MPTLEFNLTGFDAMAARLDTMGLSALRQAGRGLKEEYEDVMTTAKTEDVPVKDGILRGTGHVDEPEFSGDEVSVKGGFGGPAAPYAAKQHEDLTLHHTVGSAKFLERPLLEATAGMAGRIAGRIDLGDTA